MKKKKRNKKRDKKRDKKVVANSNALIEKVEKKGEQTVTINERSKIIDIVRKRIPLLDKLYSYITAFQERYREKIEKIEMTFGCLTMIAIIYGLYIMVTDIYGIYHGIDTRAVIIEKAVITVKAGSRRAFKYKYHVNGKTYYDKMFYDAKYKIGDTIIIRYNKEKPYISSIFDDDL